MPPSVVTITLAGRRPRGWPGCARQSRQTPPSESPQAHGGQHGENRFPDHRHVDQHAGRPCPRPGLADRRQNGFTSRCSSAKVVFPCQFPVDTKISAFWSARPFRWRSTALRAQAGFTADKTSRGTAGCQNAAPARKACASRSSSACSAQKLLVARWNGDETPDRFQPWGLSSSTKTTPWRHILVVLAARHGANIP